MVDVLLSLSSTYTDFAVLVGSPLNTNQPSNQEWQVINRSANHQWLKKQKHRPVCGCSLTSIHIYVLLEKKRKITESLEVFPCLLPSRTSPTTNLRGYDCPSLLVLLIISHLPPTPVLNPSHPHHSALLLSLLCTTLVSPPLLLYLHLWCHCPFLSCHPAPMCPLPLIRSLSHCGLRKSVPAAFFLIHIQSHCTSIFFFLSCPLLRPAHLWITAHIGNPGDSMDASTWLTSPPRAANRHWCRCTALSCRAVRPRGQGWKVTGYWSRAEAEVTRFQKEGRTARLREAIGKEGLSDRRGPGDRRWWLHTESWGGRRGAWLSMNRRWKVNMHALVSVYTLAFVHVRLPAHMTAHKTAHGQSCMNVCTAQSSTHTHTNIHNTHSIWTYVCVLKPKLRAE